MLTPAEGSLRMVDTDEGPVTVASLETLNQAASAKRSLMDQLRGEIDAAKGQIDSALTQAGWILTAQEAGWQPGDRSERIAAARGLGDLIRALQANVEAIHGRAHHGLGGVIDRMKDDHEAKRLLDDLRSAQSELNMRYRAVAEGLDRQTGIPEADALLAEATKTNANVVGFQQQLHSAAAEADGLAAEIAHRTEVQSSLGFDALGVLAELAASGIRPVSTSLVLKPREVAAVQVPATLCRHKTRTQFVGGSHGLSIPLGHGFRYRVSSFRGHPVQSEVLARLDTGSLVVTNQRLVFLGAQRDVSVPLAKLLQAEPYSDAIGIAREGKESKDIYLVSNPAYVLIYLNWVIAHATTGSQ